MKFGEAEPNMGDQGARKKGFTAYHLEDTGQDGGGWRKGNRKYKMRLFCSPRLCPPLSPGNRIEVLITSTSLNSKWKKKKKFNYMSPVSLPQTVGPRGIWILFRITYFK